MTAHANLRDATLATVTTDSRAFGRPVVQTVRWMLPRRVVYLWLPIGCILWFWANAKAHEIFPNVATEFTTIFPLLGIAVIVFERIQTLTAQTERSTWRFSYGLAPLYGFALLLLPPVAAPVTGIALLRHLLRDTLNFTPGTILVIGIILGLFVAVVELHYYLHTQGVMPDLSPRTWDTLTVLGLTTGLLVQFTVFYWYAAPNTPGSLVAYQSPVVAGLGIVLLSFTGLAHVYPAVAANTREARARTACLAGCLILGFALDHPTLAPTSDLPTPLAISAPGIDTLCVALLSTLALALLLYVDHQYTNTPPE